MEIRDKKEERGESSAGEGREIRSRGEKEGGRNVEHGL
jgi:hypothetical protein